MSLTALVMLAETIVALRDPQVLEKKPYGEYAVCLLQHVNDQGEAFETANNSQARAMIKSSEGACETQRTAAFAGTQSDDQKKAMEINIRRFEKMVSESVVPSQGSQGLNGELPIIIELN